MTELKPFDPDAKCPKCGFERLLRCYYGPNARTFLSPLVPEPHIKQHCPRCHFSWPEAPLPPEEVATLSLSSNLTDRIPLSVPEEYTDDE